MRKKKIPQSFIKTKNLSKKKKNYVFGTFGRISRISYDPMIIYDSTRSYIRSYHFYNPSAILIILVRWDRKIARSYNLDRDFDNHD